MDLRFLTADDPKWNEAFLRLPEDRRDVFHGPAYARLCEQTTCGDHRVMCAFTDTPAGPILYPFVLRELSKVAGISLPGQFDMVGLYGRNGIACDGKMPDGLIQAFHAGIAQFASENGIVCSFDRFHPILENQRQAASDEHIVDVGRFTVLELAADIDIIERNYRHSLRKDIKKAERSGVSTFTEMGTEHLYEFVSIYNHTMDRRSAKASYRFDVEYLRKLAELMTGQFLFIYAARNGELSSCELVLICGMFSHSFLGGTLRSALPFGCNQLLKRDLIRELKGLNCRYYLLGGGVAAGDGIEKYKTTFAPDGQFPSYIGGRVFDQSGLFALKQKMLDAGKMPALGRIQFYDVEE